MSAALLTSRFKILLSMGLATLSFSSLALEYITVQPEQVAEYFDLEATLAAVNESTVSAQTSGAVEAILVDVNDSVDRKSTRLNSSHVRISYAVFCLKKQKATTPRPRWSTSARSGSPSPATPTSITPSS